MVWKMSQFSSRIENRINIFRILVRLNNHEFIRWLYPVGMHQNRKNATDIRPPSGSCVPILFLTIYQNDKRKAYFELSVLNGIKKKSGWRSHTNLWAKATILWPKGKICRVMQTHQVSQTVKKIIYAIYKSATSPSALNMQCTDLYIYIIWSSLDSAIFLLCCFNRHWK